MNFKPLTIGNLTASLPIIQGGMGVGVSLSGLASAVAACGGIGVISSAQIGFDEEDFEKNPLEANLRALKKHIRLAKEKSAGGIIGVNIMCALEHYDEQVKASIEAGADMIISGAGLPTNLPALCKGSDIKLVPIISSNKAATVILKLWDRNFSTMPDAIIVEGPEAGGHLGFKEKDLKNNDTAFYEEDLLNIIDTVKTYENKYNKSIPIIAAGGVYTGQDIAHYLKLGMSGVQMATRFVATEECDASLDYKKAYINSKKEEIVIVKSPVGMPGRAIRNEFIKRTEDGNIKINKCYRCITKCNPATTPYCITRALTNAVKGDLEEGLIFCGSNAWRLDKITTVKELMDELVQELEEA